MVLSKRERYIALAALIVVAILVFDRLVLGPLEERRATIAEERQRVLSELETARLLFARRKRLAALSGELLKSGLGSDPGEAESQVLHALRNWSQEAGLALSSLRPERTGLRGSLREITFHAAGTGGIAAVAGFLWRVETAPLPLRLTELQIGSRKEGADDLSLQVRISALCPSSEQPGHDGGISRPVAGGEIP